MNAIRFAHALSGPPTGFAVAAMIASAFAPATSRTRASNAACDANGPASHTASSTEQPSAPIGLIAEAGQPFGQASAATGIVSAPVKADVSPPPTTVGALAAVTALLARFTVTVIGG